MTPETDYDKLAFAFWKSALLFRRRLQADDTAARAEHYHACTRFLLTIGAECEYPAIAERCAGLLSDLGLGNLRALPERRTS